MEVTDRWVDELGLECMIRRQDWGDGALLGYVRLPDDHPFLGFDDSDLTFVEVHGGVTYCDTLLGVADGVWIGFDCAHTGDTPENCNEAYVREQIELLASQVIMARDLAKGLGLVKLSGPGHGAHGGSVFPSPPAVYRMPGGGDAVLMPGPGISLMDYFAVRVMEHTLKKLPPVEAVRMAYDIAEAMVIESAARLEGSDG